MVGTAGEVAGAGRSCEDSFEDLIIDLLRQSLKSRAEFFDSHIRELIRALRGRTSFDRSDLNASNGLLSSLHVAECCDERMDSTYQRGLLVEDARVFVVRAVLQKAAFGLN